MQMTAMSDALCVLGDVAVSVVCVSSVMWLSVWSVFLGRDD